MYTYAEDIAVAYDIGCAFSKAVASSSLTQGHVTFDSTSSYQLSMVTHIAGIVNLTGTPCASLGMGKKTLKVASACSHHQVRY